MDNKSISERIRQARKENGKTQKDLAKYLNKSPSNISDIETGRVQVSAVDMALIADALNKPIEYFFGDDQDKEFQDMLATFRPQLADDKQQILNIMNIVLSMKTFVGDVEATDRELSTDDLKEFFGIFLSYKLQVNQMNEQVNMIGNALGEALEKEGISLTDLTDSPQD